MENNTQDRLKAFLNRNRNKNSNNGAEKEYESTPVTVTTPPNSKTKGISFQFADGLAPLSTRSPLAKDQDALNDERFTPDLFTPAFQNKAPYEKNEEHIVKGGNGLELSLGEEERKSSCFSLGSPVSFSQKEAPKEEKLFMSVQTENNRTDGSVSPIREGSRSGRSLIESYVSQKKNTEIKLKTALRSSTSREPTKFFTPTKSKGTSSTHNLNTSTAMSTRSEILDTQGSISARQPRGFKALSRDFSQTEVKQKTQKQANPQRLTNNSLFSSNTKKPREERREFVFEEDQTSIRGNKTSRNASRSKDPLRPTSLTPKGLRSQEKKPSIIRQQTPQQQKSEKGSIKSHLNTPKQQQNEFFPESSKRLQILDSSSNTEAKFKKEIKGLIQIIRHEKEQITEDLQAMSKELTKYKTAYKQLKKQLDKQAKEFMEKMNVSSSQNEQPIQNNTNTNELEQIANQEDKASQRSNNTAKRNEDSKPFTIDELTSHFDKNIPSLSEEGHVELLSKMKHINSDVENIVARAKTDFSLNKENFVSSTLELQSFQLRKNAVNCYIIKEMNLASHMFFQDNIKETEQDAEFKPTVIDLLAAQREIIHFLIRKLEIEEKQRLKTEDQASMMIAQVEKSIKQMEERGTGSRKKELASTTEVNKSINLQV